MAGADRLAKAMKRPHVFLILALVALFGIALHVVMSRQESCASELLSRTDSPKRSFTAEHRNEVCKSAPDSLRISIWISDSRGFRGGQTLVFNANARVDPALDRATRVAQISFIWVRDDLLLITPKSGVTVQSSDTAPQGLQIMVADSATATSSVNPIRTVSDLQAVLETEALGARRAEVFDWLYGEFGSANAWPLVDALWKRQRANFPDWNWRAVEEPIFQINLAALWGQWSREFGNSPTAAEAAAVVIRQHLGAVDPKVSQAAIESIGMVGDQSDLTYLLNIGLGTDEYTGKLAISAIASIESRRKAHASLLPRIASEAQMPKLQAFAKERLKRN